MSSMTVGRAPSGGTNLRCLDFNCFPRLSRLSRLGIGERLEVGNWRGESSEGQVLALLATWCHLTVAKNPRHPGHHGDHLSACKHPLLHKSIPAFGATFFFAFLNLSYQLLSRLTWTRM